MRLNDSELLGEAVAPAAPDTPRRDGSGVGVFEQTRRTKTVTDLLKKLEDWYAAQCDGEWEQRRGIEIGTLDNPGWLLKADLSGTPLQDRSYPKIARGVNADHHPTAPIWLDCEVIDGVFRGAGDAHRLSEIIGELVRWTDRELAGQPITVEPLSEPVRGWASALLERAWGSPVIVTRGVAHQADRLPGFAARMGDIHVGLVTYRLAEDECEIVSLNSLIPGFGVGTALVKAVRKLAAVERCRRVWLVTTNDNTPAVRFYQKLGFRICAVHRDALERSRELKPQIPDRGVDGIPIRDEVELDFAFPR